jgi:hypothetical protein
MAAWDKKYKNKPQSICKAPHLEYIWGSRGIAPFILNLSTRKIRVCNVFQTYEA